MKNKLQYLIISVLIISNLFFIFNSKKKSSKIDNEEFRREMNYLRERIGYNKEQIKLAGKDCKAAASRQVKYLFSVGW